MISSHGKIFYKDKAEEKNETISKVGSLSDWNQRKISLLEQKEAIEPELLEQVIKVLKVPMEAIQNFDEEKAVHTISNTFNDSCF